MFSNKDKVVISLLAFSLTISIVLNVIQRTETKTNINIPETMTTNAEHQFDSIAAFISNHRDSILQQFTNPRYDLNSITGPQLEEIPGIGPVLAERILQFKKQIGKFSDLNQLKKVKGIGEQKFAQIIHYLYIR